MVLLYDYRIERERKEATRKEIEAEGIVRFQAKAGAVLTDKYLTLRSIDATLELAKSPNTKVIVTGSRLSPVVLTDGK